MYTFDKDGFRNYKLEIKNLKTNKVFFRGESNVRSFEWLSNDQVVFVIEDQSKKQPITQSRRQTKATRRSTVTITTRLTFRTPTKHTWSR